MFIDSRGIVYVLLDQSVCVFNPRKFTLRGMHYQIAPYQRNKLIRCLSGSARLNVVNIATGESKSHMLKAGDAPVMVECYQACGYLTLEDSTVIHYEMDGKHSPPHERGFRWNDPRLCLEWDAVPLVINERDENWPNWQGIE